MVGLRDGEKNFEDMLTVYTQYRRVTDGQTDRQTDRQTDILPRHSPRYAYASRGKKSDRVYLLAAKFLFYTMCWNLETSRWVPNVNFQPQFVSKMAEWFQKWGPDARCHARWLKKVYHGVSRVQFSISVYKYRPMSQFSHSSRTRPTHEQPTNDVTARMVCRIMTLLLCDRRAQKGLRQGA